MRAVSETGSGSSSTRILAATATVSSACVLPSFLLGGMAVQVRRALGFEASGIGVAFAVFFTMAALASAPGGRLADRSDPVRVVRGAAVVSAATSLFLAAFAQSLTTVVACMAVAGVANAACQSAANLVIVRALPAHRQGFGFAIKQSAIPGAALLAGAAVPAMALTFGWRWAFVLGAGLSVAAAGSVPADAGSGRSAGATETESEDEPAPAPDPGSVPDVRDRRLPPGARGGAAPGQAPAVVRARPDLPLRTLALLALAVGLGATATSSLASFLVSAAVDADVAEGSAGVLLTVSSVAGIAVRLLIGARADRRDGRHIQVVALLMTGGAAAFALLAVSAPVVYLVASPLAFCTAWSWQGLFTLIIVQANPSSPAAATGTVQTGTFFGAVIGPLLFGTVVDHAGYGAAWLMASGISLLATTALIAGHALMTGATAPTTVPATPPPAGRSAA